MKIDKKLNLTFPVDLEDGTKVHIFSTPISRSIFETYFLTITRTFAVMTEQGSAWLLRMGPRTAKLMLKRTAEADNAWSGPGGVEFGLLGEIRRLTNVLAPMPNGGWDLLPFQDAKDKGLLSAEEADEVEQALVFFIVVSSSMKPNEAGMLLEPTFGLLDGCLTSSDITAFQASLKISTPVESTGVKPIQKPSSIPH